MSFEIISTPAFKWIFGIAGMMILISIAYYLVEKIKEGRNVDITSPEENLAEFERLYYEGKLDKKEFQIIKEKLSREIVEKTKQESQ